VRTCWTLAGLLFLPLRWRGALEGYGDIHEGIAALSRPRFVNLLAAWFAAIRTWMRACAPSRRPASPISPAARAGRASRSRAYPEVTVDAIDVDQASIDATRAHIAGAGLGERARPVVRDASEPGLEGGYELVTIFEALHDMNHPVEALRASREMLAEGAAS
jgi:hypothetical protein